MKRGLFNFYVTAVFCFFFFNMLYAQENPTNIHGFISQGYIKTTRNDFIEGSKDGTFQFNEMGLNFSHRPTNKLNLAIQFFARDLGSTGNDDIIVDFAFADYRFQDYFGIRGGKMKNPIGLYSETRDVDMLRTCILLPLSVYDELLRSSQSYIQGIGIYGDINTSRLGSLSYQVLSGTNNIPSDSADADFLELGMTDINSVEMDTTYSCALVYSDPFGMVRLGGSYYYTQLDVDSIARNHYAWPFLGVTAGDEVHYEVQNIEIYTASIEFIFNNLVLSAESKLTKMRDLVLLDKNKGTIFREARDQYGHYIMMAYRFNRFLETSIYYEEFFPYEDDRKGHNPIFGYRKTDHWLKKWAFSCKIDINANWLLKLETQYVDGTAYLIYDDTPQEHWFLYAAKVTYNF